MKSRLIIILTGLIFLWGLMLMRSAYLQVLPNDKLNKLQKRQFEKVVEVRARRGAIYDRNGKELAVSVSSWSLFADPGMIEQPIRLARKLSVEFGFNYKETLEKLTQNTRFTWLRRQMTEKERDLIQGWHTAGLSFIEEPKRIYPNDSLLAQAIGFIGREGTGLEGLELQYESLLQGQKKKISLQRDARGRPLLSEGFMTSQVPDAPDIHLTIDAEIQYMLEQELLDSIREQQADSAMGVVLEAQTSEVVAIASVPSFNPNALHTSAVGQRKLKPVTDIYEPGSTLKTFVIAAALREKLIQPNTRFDCENGKMKVGDRIVREADSKHAWSSLTVSEILAHSSNIGATKIAFALGAEKFHQALLDFGFGEVTGADLPGEARGVLHEPPWRPHLLSNISFGHGISTTALQVANAYAAIANGGILHKPYIVKTVSNAEVGTEVISEPKEIRRVLSPQVAEQMKLMLMGVTGPNGTGENAKVPGFPVAGKTGTAQKVNPLGKGYLQGTYVSSFAGFIPANDPKYVIYVVVDQPRKAYYGSQVAAPIFSRIASFAIQKSGLSPVLISQKTVLSEGKKNKPQINHVKKERPIATHTSITPELTKLSLREVFQRINGVDLAIQVQGRGMVSRTIPNAGEPLPENRVITVLME